jgi:hypothetical protein
MRRKEEVLRRREQLQRRIASQVHGLSLMEILLPATVRAERSDDGAAAEQAQTTIQPGAPATNVHSMRRKIVEGMAPLPEAIRSLLFNGWAQVSCLTLLARLRKNWKGQSKQSNDDGAHASEYKEIEMIEASE